jgi:hypothetical protein
VTRQGSNLPARLTRVSQGLETVSQNVGELLRRAVERQDRGGLNPNDLRLAGRQLVSLAGDLTTLGVNMAGWADELDEATDTDG